MRVRGYVVRASREPMRLEAREETPGRNEVIVRVEGCGVCHTDLGFYYDGVPTRRPLPLTLGHEVVGEVVDAGDGAAAWLGRRVIVPAVIPCGACDACRSGRGAVCPEQVFPGSDVHGGFATHLRVPGGGLCAVPDLDDPAANPAGLAPWQLAVIADAVSTPYQAIRRSGLAAGDAAVFVGVGGIGGFGVQLAAAAGAHVLALDVAQDRLRAIAEHGASETIDVSTTDPKDVRRRARAFASSRGIPPWRVRVFETSGTPAGQRTAFSLLGPGGHLSVVGYSTEAVEIKLSNLMAFDATVQGNWACLPEHYPEVLAIVLSGRVAIAPFVERRPLSSIQETFEDVHARRVSRRVVLVPEA